MVVGEPQSMVIVGDYIYLKEKEKKMWLPVNNCQKSQRAKEVEKKKGREEEKRYRTFEYKQKIIGLNRLHVFQRRLLGNLPRTNLMFLYRSVIICKNDSSLKDLRPSKPH